MEELTDVEPVRMMLDTNWDEEFHVAPLRDYTSVELFAGAGGLSEGFIRAGFSPLAHIEMDKNACNTLKTRAAYHWLKANNITQVFIRKELRRIC